MGNEENEQILCRAEEIEKEVKEITERIAGDEAGFKVLKTGLRKAAFSFVRSLTLGLTRFKELEHLDSIQQTLSHLRVLDYYIYISKRVGYFSPTPYLILSEKVREMREFLTRGRRKVPKPEKSPELRFSLQGQDR